MGIITVLFIIIDLISKYVVTKYLDLNDSITLIKNFLSITHVKNTGVAFSMFSSNRYFVLIMSLIIIFLIVYYIFCNKPSNKLEKVGYSLILSGAIGNLINRITCGYVTDFIDIKIFDYDYPIFNLADIFIVIGVTLLLIYTWRCKDGNKS